MKATPENHKQHAILPWWKRWFKKSSGSQSVIPAPGHAGGNCSNLPHNTPKVTTKARHHTFHHSLKRGDFAKPRTLDNTFIAISVWQDLDQNTSMAFGTTLYPSTELGHIQEGQIAIAWKKRFLTGLVTPETSVQWLQQLQKVTGDGYLKDGFVYKVSDELSLFASLVCATANLLMVHIKDPAVPEPLRQWYDKNLNSHSTEFCWYPQLQRSERVGKAWASRAIDAEFARHLAECAGLGHLASPEAESTGRAGCADAEPSSTFSTD